ncbi:hypothetical protein H257_03873 [Aphanomyces astaci]|uniref:Uncharacterized protein n=1 Tax=Aphanomyces astaci TaxID=112090 RepID=W4GZL6_APHAT|nr:hypothetical protein H257_03873 [Aphanomyces astaci]ETV84776.1 hypothetical protein H257_03873 [Aphanomyces astaci]|eukprot:XP_009826468.1 hypothetical protein H257_03873 [Aphanomyces astaci]
MPPPPPYPLKMSTTAKPKQPKASHYLGGSNNLLQERKRREVAERQVKETSANLHTLAVDLVPKVNALAHAVQVLEFENTQQLDLEAVSQDTFLSLQQQVEVLRQHQLDMQVKLHKAMDAKLERAQHEMRLDHEAVVMTVDNVKIEVDSMKEQLAIIRGEMDSLRNAANAKLSQTQSLLDNIRDQSHKDSQLTSHSLHDLDMKIGALDSRLFALDKEHLKLRLCLPPSLAARTCFDTSAPHSNDLNPQHHHHTNNNHGSSQRLEQLHLEMESMMHDMGTQRSADRIQFEAISNRVREMAKAHHQKHELVLVELQEMHDKLAQATTKWPVEVAHRLECMRQTWEADIASLKLAANTWAATTSNSSQEATIIDDGRHAATKDLLLALQARIGDAEHKMGKLSTAVHAHHIGAGTQMVKVQKDMGRVQGRITRSHEIVMQQLVNFHDLLAELRQAVAATTRPPTSC